MKSSEHFDSSTDGADREVHTSNGRQGPLDVLSKFQAEVLAAGGRLLEIYRDRARLSTRRAFVALISGAGATVFIAVALGSAALAVTSGACAAFTELFGGRAWLGSLAGGLAVLVSLSLALVVVNGASERKALKSLRAKYGDSPHDHPQETDTATENSTRDIRR